MVCRTCQSNIAITDTQCPTCGSSIGFDQNAETQAAAAAVGQQETAPLTHWSEPAGSSAILHALLPGTVIGGRYEIIKLLGQGGMGAVCQARDREVDRIVALKVVRGDLAGKAAVLQRFKRELVLAQRVTHPNVVRIYDLGVAGEMRFITMEYIDGNDLKHLAHERGAYPPQEAAGIMLQVFRGLAAAHAVGIVHRDLKPANIMIDRNGRVAVMDFGIARSIETMSAPDNADPDATAAMPQNELTLDGQVVGTPVYMSPEQARRQVVDQRSDLFTAGLILYSLVTGKIPAAGSTVKETLRSRASSSRVKSLIEADPSVPPALNDIVMRCLEIDPARRYQSAGEVVEALEGFLGGGPATRSRWRSPKAAVAACLVAAGAGAAAWFAFKPAPQTTHAPVKVILSDFTNSTGNTLLDGALEPMLAINLEGASFITVYNRGQARRLATQMSGSPALDVKTAQLVAQREGVGVVVAGGVSRDGGKYRLTVRALDTTTGNSIAEQSSTSDSPEALSRAVNEAGATVRRQLGDVTPVSTQIAAAETFTSRSLEASRDYSQAQELQWKGKLEEALASYRRSVEKDPDLGRAYAGMAVALSNLDRRKEAEQMYRTALSKIDRMSDREKYRTRGGYYLLRREYNKSTEQFEQLVKLYPADTAGMGNLALSYFYQRNMVAAVEAGRKAVAIYPGNVLQLNNLGLYLMYAGEFEDALAQFRKVLAANPGYERAYIGQGLSQLAQGRPLDARASYEKLASLTPRGASMAALALADLALYEGRTADAVAILDAGIKADAAGNESTRAASKYVAFGDALIAAGRRAQAADAAARAVALNGEDKVLYAAAIVYLYAGQETKALALAAQLASRLGPEAETFSKLIQGETRLQRREYRDAVTLFQSAQKISDTWLGRFGLGRAYLGAGGFAEADGEFETCLKRRGEATAVFLEDEPSYRYFPQLYYYTGRAQEGLRSPGAAESYRTFLKIKEKASGDPMVEDARKRVVK